MVSCLVSVSSFPLFYKEVVPVWEDDPMSFGVQRNVSYESGGVQVGSSRPSNARFAMFECSQHCLLTADADVGETVPMPMPMRRSFYQNKYRIKAEEQETVCMEHLPREHSLALQVHWFR
jgi:hypothetical protein